MRRFKFINHFFILLLFSFFISCGLPYCIKHKLSDEDLKWMEAYSIGDTICFENNIFDVDTMIITHKELFNPSNTFIFDCRDCIWMEDSHDVNGYGLYEFSFTHDGKKYKEGFFLIRKKHSKKPAGFGFCFLGNYNNEEINECGEYIFYNIPTDKSIVKISKSQYSHGGSDPYTLVDEILWERDAGLIGYKIGNDWYIRK